MKNQFIILTLSLCLTGCSHRFHQQSSLVIPENWQSDVPLSVDLETIDVNWWENFSDCTLNALMEQAKENNFDLKMALLNDSTSYCDAWSNISADIAKNYIEFRFLQQKQDLFKESIALENEALQFSKDLLKRGVINETEVNQSEASKINLEKQLPLIEVGITKSLNHLSTLMGLTPGDLLICLSEKNSLQVPKKTSLGSPLDLLHNRSDVKKAYQDYLKTTSGLAVFTSDKLKSLSFYNYQKKFINSLEDVENAMAAVKQSEIHLQYLNSTEDKLLSNVQLSEDLNRRGLVDSFSVLKAKKALLAAKIEKKEGLQTLLLNYLLLYKALGNNCCL